MTGRISYKPLSDRVRVALVMGAGKIKPVWFVSTDLPCRERIMVKEICYTWQYLEGMAKVRCYEVSDGVNAYKLELNTSDFTWRLGVAEQTCL